MTPFQSYIHKSRYSRWREDLGRRENWDETVARYFDFFENHFDASHHGYLDTYTKHRKRIEPLVRNLEVMPSMRCLMTAGEALHRDHVAGFNCAYVTMDRTTRFDEILYVLMCGTGEGFSVESRYTKQLPIVADQFTATDTTIVVADSKTGWAHAYRQLVHLLYSGQIPQWDLSRVRAAGARLKTFGGRASGPGPLEDLFKYTVGVFQKAAGRRLTTLEVHDVVCKIASVVVVGGVRRSALISLSDLDDRAMRDAKSGDWYSHSPHRALANNSAVYEERPTMGVFLEEWHSLYKSGSGERGIFNRDAARYQAGRDGRRLVDVEFGTNPCSEIILRPQQFCNLTEAVVRPHYTGLDLQDRVEAAAVMGTWQATLTDFRYLSPQWKRNTEEEALLGVSLTGIMDDPHMYEGESLSSRLNDLRLAAIATNKREAKKLDINQAAAVTCVKPSGTVSQLVDCASGIHPRYSPYYVRRTRMSKLDPLSTVLKDQGVPCEDAVGDEANTEVFSFPTKAPEGVAVSEKVRAVDQLQTWALYQDAWCDHKPSVTINMREHEWLEVGDWTYKNFDKISGVSYLPFETHVYKQPPYEKISQESYESLVAKMPSSLDWTVLDTLESTDNTTSSQELACTGGSCDIV